MEKNLERPSGEQVQKGRLGVSERPGDAARKAVRNTATGPRLELLRKHLVRVSLLLLSLSLAACGTQSVTPSSEATESSALLSDADIDRAVLAVGEVTKRKIDLDALRPRRALESAMREHSLTPQAVLPGAHGYLVYILNNRNSATAPWQLYRYDQDTNTKTRVYGGKRAIQSVAITRDGTYLVFVMKETTASSSDYEVYGYHIPSKTLTQITNTSYSESDVALSWGGGMTVWEGTNDYGKRTVFYRTSGGTTRSLWSHYPIVEPSVVLVGSDYHITFVRQPNPKYLNTYTVVSFNMTTSANYNVHTVEASTGITLAHPSTSGSAWAWKERHGRYEYYVKLFRVGGSVQTVVSSSSILGHPYLTADGRFLTYLKGRSPIYTKNLSTNQTAVAVSVSSPKKLLAPFWQQ